jgi:ethanolamine utilization microcompartment shell protein EutL
VSHHLALAVQLTPGVRVAEMVKPPVLAANAIVADIKAAGNLDVSTYAVPSKVTLATPAELVWIAISWAKSTEPESKGVAVRHIDTRVPSVAV